MGEKDILRKLMYAGVGLVDLAAEKVESAVDELAKRGEDSSGPSKKYAEDIIVKAKEAKEKAEKVITGKAFATKEEVRNLEAKLDEILAALNKIKGEEPKVEEPVEETPSEATAEEGEV